MQAYRLGKKGVLRQLKIINGGGRPRAFRRPSGERQLWVCHQPGCDCSTLVPVLVDVALIKGKPKGRKTLACASCLAKGIISEP